MLGKSTKLELGHGLLVWAGIHVDNRLWYWPEVGLVDVGGVRCVGGERGVELGCVGTRKSEEGSEKGGAIRWVQLNMMA